MKGFLILLSLILATTELPAICIDKLAQQNPVSNQRQQFQTDKLRRCFTNLIQKQQYESIDMLQQSLNQQEEAIMVQLLNQQIKRLQAIQQYVIQVKTTCEPVLKWAQNYTHVFVAAKLSHRWDSPPCLKSTSQKYELSESSLEFINVCLVSNAEIKFYFNLQLYRKCRNQLQVKKDGVGTYSLMFQKQKQQIWPYLFLKQKPIQIWHEVMNRNSTVKQQFQKMLREIEAISSATPKSEN